MRLINALKNDIRFQIKYGFYFLYAFFSGLYIVILMLIPAEYKNIAASLIILTDPAMIGIFFIGGIWLLEKGEGLHRFWQVSPLRTLEYVIAKSLSLAVLSTISADFIALIGLGGKVHFGLLTFSVFSGAAVFTLIGLIAASFARSVNHYMIIVIIPTVCLTIPPVLTAFGITHPLLEIFPGTVLWHLIHGAVDGPADTKIWMWVLLFFWLGLMLSAADGRIREVWGQEGRRIYAKYDETM